jgi:hypothetical protein
MEKHLLAHRLYAEVLCSVVTLPIWNLHPVSSAWAPNAEVARLPRDHRFADVESQQQRDNTTRPIAS